MDIGIMKVGRGYRALSQRSTTLSVSQTLLGLISSVRTLPLKHREFVVRADLRAELAQFPQCARCEGKTKVETDRIAWRWVRDEYSPADFSKHVIVACPDCEGLGVSI
jgi:hypothetical protein